MASQPPIANGSAADRLSALRLLLCGCLAIAVTAAAAAGRSGRSAGRPRNWPLPLPGAITASNSPTPGQSARRQDHHPGLPCHSRPHGLTWPGFRPNGRTGHSGARDTHAIMRFYRSRPVCPPIPLLSRLQPPASSLLAPLFSAPAFLRVRRAHGGGIGRAQPGGLQGEQGQEGGVEA